MTDICTDDSESGDKRKDPTPKHKQTGKKDKVAKLCYVIVDDGNKAQKTVELFVFI